MPYALAVDAIAVPSSNGNQVLESGELVVVQPWWRNVNGATLTFDGAASTFSGPAGPAYTIADGNAGYGSLPTNTAGSCGPGAGCYAMRVTGARPTPHWDSSFRENIAPAALVRHEGVDPPRRRHLHRRHAPSFYRSWGPATQTS